MHSLQLPYLSCLQFPADLSAGLSALNLLRDKSYSLLEVGKPSKSPLRSKVPTLPDKKHVHSSLAARQGYEEALAIIHRYHPAFTVETLFLLHERVFHYLDQSGGQFKPSDNFLYNHEEDGSQELIHTPLSSKEIPEAMKRLIQAYETALQTYDPLVVIPLTLMDFILIHPFLDGNGRMFRLLAVLLLYDAGFSCALDLNFDKVLQNSRGLGQAALGEGIVGWREGQHQSLPWIRYFVGALSYATAHLALTT